MIKRLVVLGSLCWFGLAHAEPLDLVRALESNDFAAIEQRYGESMRKAFPAGSLAKLFESLRKERGKIVGCKLVRPGMAQCAVEKPPTIDLFFDLNSASEIVSLGIKDTKPAPPEPPPARTRLRPPFAGVWTARNAFLDQGNGHFRNAQQRYAVDWLITDAQGRSYAGDPKQLASYYAYGKPALAAAAGQVVVVIDGVPENPPGLMDTYNVAGNQIVLEIAPGEYAYYAHLQPGSMRVKVGSRVESGQPLALVGNSGNTSEPHLHFQISTRPNLYQAESLPALFVDSLLDGKPVERARPMGDQRLEYREKR